MICPDLVTPMESSAFIYGRQVDINQVILNSIPIYVLCVPILPVGVQRFLNSLMSKFLWDGFDNNRKFHLVDWDTVSEPIDRMR